MAKITRKTPVTLWDFMNRANDFVNVEDTLGGFDCPRYIGQIYIITGGLTNKGVFASGWKAYFQRVRYEEVFSVGRKPQYA